MVTIATEAGPFVQQFIDSVPFASSIGFTQAVRADGAIAIRQSRTPQSLTKEGRIDYGVAIAMLDQIFAAAILWNAPDRLITTVNIHVDWFDAWTDEDYLIAVVSKARLSERTGWATATILASGERVVGEAVANFMLDAAPGGGIKRDWTGANVAQRDWTSFQDFLHIREEGDALLLLPAEQLVGMRFLPAFHGGVIACALQRATELALGRSTDASVLSQDVSYMRPAIATRKLTCRAQTIRKGRRVAFMSAVAVQDDGAGDSKLVARSSVTYVTGG